MPPGWNLSNANAPRPPADPLQDLPVAKFPVRRDLVCRSDGGDRVTRPLVPRSVPAHAGRGAVQEVAVDRGGS